MSFLVTASLPNRSQARARGARKSLTTTKTARAFPKTSPKRSPGASRGLPEAPFWPFQSQNTFQVGQFSVIKSAHHGFRGASAGFRGASAGQHDVQSGLQDFLLPENCSNSPLNGAGLVPRWFSEGLGHAEIVKNPRVFVCFWPLTLLVTTSLSHRSQTLSRGARRSLTTTTTARACPKTSAKRASRSPRGRLVAPIWPFKKPDTPQLFEVRGQFWSLLACRMANLAQETVNMMSTPGWKPPSCHKMASTRL